MQFLMTTNPDDGDSEIDPAVFAEMNAFIEELTRSGVLVATGGLDAGTRVSTAGDTVTVTDGPFVETKEQIVSFALVDVATREEAMEVIRRFHGIFGRRGVTTLHQVYGPETA